VLVRPVEPAAFTLIELLAVVAIIGVLALIALTAAGGASERSRRQRCRADLALLAQALEGYRAQLGDYPRTGPAANDPTGTAATDDGPGILFNALTGRRGPGVPLVPTEFRQLVSLSVLTLQTDDLPTAGSTSQTANAFLDPWGRRYLYFYRTGPAWNLRAPLLLSAGPDGMVTIPADLAAWDGTLPAGGGANNDNLIASGS
jgi:prepilin-type N-terminal cleavage/methylation domain-containing protein